MRMRIVNLPLVAVLSAAALLSAACNIAPEATRTLPPRTVVESDTKDVDVTMQVKSALSRDKTVNQFDIVVATRKGDVKLIGAVDTQAQITQAIKIARAVDGVHSIHDELRTTAKGNEEPGTAIDPPNKTQ